MELRKWLIYSLFCSMSLLLPWSLCLAQGTYFKWTDENGKVHYSNAPPGYVDGEPLGIKDEPEDVRATRARRVDEVGDKIKRLVERANWLMEQRSNSLANRDGLIDVATQLQLASEEYESRGKFAIAVDPNSTVRTVYRDTLEANKRKINRYINLIGHYIQAQDY